MRRPRVILAALALAALAPLAGASASSAEPPRIAIAIPGQDLEARTQLESAFRAGRAIQAERGRYPTSAALARALARANPGTRFLALPSASGVPPVAVVGVWSNARASAAFSARGRRVPILRLIDRAGRVSRNY